MWDVVAEHLLSFGFGVVIGLGLSSRYRVVRIRHNTSRNGDS